MLNEGARLLQHQRENLLDSHVRVWRPRLEDVVGLGGPLGKQHDVRIVQKEAGHKKRTLALGKAAAELVSDARHEEDGRAQRVRAEGGEQRLGEELDLRQSFLAIGD